MPRSITRFHVAVVLEQQPRTQPHELVQPVAGGRAGAASIAFAEALTSELLGEVARASGARRSLASREGDPTLQRSCPPDHPAPSERCTFGAGPGPHKGLSACAKLCATSWKIVPTYAVSEGRSL
jgi:hypothetical protein